MYQRELKNSTDLKPKARTTTFFSATETEPQSSITDEVSEYLADKVHIHE